MLLALGLWDGAWARLLRFLPRWLQGQVTQDVMAAAGVQIADLVNLAVPGQLYVSSTDWGLAFDLQNDDGPVVRTGWEPDYGLPTITGDGLDMRRARVLARRRGAAMRNDADFRAYVRALVLPVPTDDADARVHPGEYVVYVLADEGWPSNFADLEGALALVGPAHLGMYLAPHDAAQGLTLAQGNQLALVAGNELTLLQLNGPIS